MIENKILLSIIYLFRYSLSRFLYGIYHIGVLAKADPTLCQKNVYPPKCNFTDL